jgi:hypothetical protein
VKADSEEEGEEGDQQQASFLIIFKLYSWKMRTVFKLTRLGSSFYFICSLRISDQGFHCTKSKIVLCFFSFNCVPILSIFKK